MKVLLIGNGAREHAIARAIKSSPLNHQLFAVMSALNVGIAGCCEEYLPCSYKEHETILWFAKKYQVDFVMIGPEGPLENGIVDFLQNNGIHCVGPTKKAAQIETSKSFARNLMKEFNIPGLPDFWVITNEEELESCFKEHRSENQLFVVKPDGLTGGKGVMVEGDHFHGDIEGMEIARDYLKKNGSVLIERKLEGEEFSLQFFCDGKTIVPMPLVRDYKRRLVDDQGLNTGSMGSYSWQNHSLPFVMTHNLSKAKNIVQRVVDALREKQIQFKGILYASFMQTAQGVKIIEFNARFGDPEAINVLAILKTDFVEICQAIIYGHLDKMEISFKNLATVCKYVVPVGYGLSASDPRSKMPEGIGRDLIEIPTADNNIYYSSVVTKPEDHIGTVHLTSSRAVAVLGIHEDVAVAEEQAEKLAQSIEGWVDHRPDIGTQKLINKGVEHMQALLSTN